jgi:hypothetical protein
MTDRPTVIRRYLVAVTDDLRQRGGSGAASQVWRAANTFEPAGRSTRHEDETRRLFLLVDRACRHWAAGAARAVGAEDIATQLAALSPVDDAARASDAEQSVASCRPALAAFSTPRPGRAEAEQSLSQAQLALRNAAQVDDPSALSEPAAAAVEHAAAGMVHAFYAGAFGGIPEDAAETVALLDSLGQRGRVARGAQAAERESRESLMHHTLVSSLASRLALEGVDWQYGAGFGTLPAPPRVGRHEPDLLGRDAGGAIVIGEAKLGPELLSEHTAEQLADFSTYAPDDEAATLYLMVPFGWKAEAEEAVRAAGGSLEQVTIRELELPHAPQPPK